MNASQKQDEGGSSRGPVWWGLANERLEGRESGGSHRQEKWGSQSGVPRRGWGLAPHPDSSDEKTGCCSDANAPKWIDRLDIIPVRSRQPLCTNTLVLKFTWKCREPQRTKRTFKKELPGVKIYSELTVVKKQWCSFEGRQINQRNKTQSRHRPASRSPSS